MKIATAEQMRNIDRRAIREWGIPGTVLMENAAAGIVSEMERFSNGLDGMRVGIICGKGNNGGDGLALARRLRIRGVPVRVALLAPFTALEGEAKVNLAILRKTDIDILPNASRQGLTDIIQWSDVLVDALLGTGLGSPLKGAFAQTVEMINSSGKPVVAIDMPTGINSDTGAVMGNAIKADLTVTMGLLKRGLVLYPGALHAGKVNIADLGIPPEIIEQENIRVNLLGPSYSWGIIRPRTPDSHKGNYGHLLAIAGSTGKAGAAVMVAKAGLRSGTGLVSVATPNSLVPIIQQQAFEAMCIPSAESIDGTLGIGAENELLRVSRKMSALAIGPGLSTHPETVQVVRNLVKRLAIPAVIDADGLNALADSVSILKELSVPMVLTPHPGEMARLAGMSVPEIQNDRIGVASNFASTYKVTLLLKGAATVIANPNGDIFINSTGNAGMATGGTGDALTGIIGALLAQGYTATQAACLGAYLHGLAGDLAAAEKGEVGMIAGDLIEKIPDAIRKAVK